MRSLASHGGVEAEPGETLVSGLGHRVARDTMHQFHELFSRRFAYTHRVPACPAIGRPEGPEETHDDGLLVAHGPTLSVTAFGGENFYALTCGWMQSGRGNAVLVRAIVDGPVETWTHEGDLDDWPRYFHAFLEIMPAGLAGAVLRLYRTLRDDIGD